MNMSDSPYDMVARGKLKLKNDSNRIGKNKKKDKKRRENTERQLNKVFEYEKEQTTNGIQEPAMTKAELSFKKMREKMVK